MNAYFEHIPVLSCAIILVEVIYVVATVAIILIQITEHVT